MGFDNSASDPDLIFSDLEEIGNELDGVEPAEEQWRNLPEGKYVGRVNRMYFDKYDPNERPILKWEFIVTEGDYEGRKQEKASFLKTEQTVSMLKADLKKAGLDMNGRGITFAKLPNHLGELLDVEIEFAVIASKKSVDKNGNPYVNVYINKRISDPFACVDVDGDATQKAKQHKQDQPSAATRRTF